MSIPKDKTILLKIKEIIAEKGQTADIALMRICALVEAYEDPGYIGGPIVGEEETEEV
jgi:hypothetical protein